MWGDERAICEEGTIMNGGLGQRSSSTGSLQWLQQQQSIVISSCTPLNPRKIGKVGVSPCPRERFGVWICRTASRRKAGMALLLLVSLLVFISFLFTLNKDGDELGLDVPGRYPATVSMTIIASRQSPVGHPGHPIGSPKSAKLGTPIEVNNTSSVMPLPRNKSTIQLPVTYFPSGHPCQHFSLPPPPADKKRTGPRPCPVCYLPVEKAIQLMPAIPSDTPIINNLTYVTERVSAMPTPGNGGSDFGGYPTLKQREDYFNIRESMHVHCGFAKGSTPGNATGFDIDKEDLFDMAQCHGIVVASAIFGNYDELQQPKNISEKAKRDVCFFMFIDEETESFLRKTSALDDSKRIGLWRIVVVHNLPYPDSRRNGKIPKLLLHRLFPNVRFSLWLDGKLELVVDPYQILERFLWRSSDTFAISRHYRRFDVFEEAEANKAAGKYDNASIDAQVEFYRREGLTHYNSSKFPITSDVPEGCVIIREHTPITNLFTCLWFNEVDRFTSRDQISFVGAEETMAKAQNSEEKKICHWISTCNPGIGIHMFVPMMLVSLALIIRHWQAVREVLLTSIPICCFTQVELQRLDSVFWLILCNIIIVLLSIESGLLCVTSSTDQYGDSSSFVQEIETWPKQQSALEGTGTESREAHGKNEWVNSISMSLTVTQPEQKQPSAKRTRTRINGMTQGKRQDDSDMKNSMAQDQALGESEPMVTVDGSSDELRQRCDDFIVQFRNQIHFQNSGTMG